MIQYSEMQLDALRELANIGSGTAATALSSLLDRPVDLHVPKASANRAPACSVQGSAP